MFAGNYQLTEWPYLGPEYMRLLRTVCRNDLHHGITRGEPARLMADEMKLVVVCKNAKSLAVLYGYREKQDRGSRIEDRGSRIEDQGSRIGDRESSDKK